MSRRGNRGAITPAILLFVAAGLYLTYRSWAVTGAVLAPPPVPSLPSASEQVASVDLAQARELIGVLMEQRPYELRDALQEAWERGPGWQRRLTEAITMLDLAALPEGPWVTE